MSTENAAHTSNIAGANRSKVDQPHKEFTSPADVVEDPTLAAHEKRAALDALEQDAKQLAIASSEGMTGGEESNLHDVLTAKEKLAEDPVDPAIASAIHALEKKLGESRSSDELSVVANAVDALRAAQAAIEKMDTVLPPGVPTPGSQEELEEELAKEKLDP